MIIHWKPVSPLTLMSDRRDQCTFRSFSRGTDTRTCYVVRCSVTPVTLCLSPCVVSCLSVCAVKRKRFQVLKSKSSPQQHYINIVHGLTPLLRGIGCVLSQTTSGAKTRRVLRARGAGAEYAMHHCLVRLAWKQTSGDPGGWKTNYYVTV